jgi:tol-pal system protein YbgF
MLGRRARLAFLSAVLPLSGCLATRNDLRVLQADLAVIRAEAARNDSARVRQVNEVLQAVRGLRTTGDSIRALSQRVAKWQGDQKEELYAMQQQLLTIQELTGLSQRRLLELRANLEERAQDAGTTPSPVTSPATGTPNTSPAPSTATPAAAPTAAPSASAASGPGPNQLLQLSLDQLRRGSAGSARAGFQDLLAQFPKADVAPLAQFYVAETYAQEGKAAPADSVYLLVVQRYPTSEKAATALYKHGLHLLATGKRTEARAVFADVVKRFPRSDEAVLAAARTKDGG